MSKRLVITATALLLACLATAAVRSSAYGDSKEPKPLEPKPLETRVFMRVKLRSTGKVLEGIVTRDFALVEKAAGEMQDMNHAAQWPKSKDDTYKHFGEEFRRLCFRLAELSREKNLDGISFTYLQLTSSCIKCHDYVSDSLTRSKDPRSPFQLIPNARVQRNPKKGR